MHRLLWLVLLLALAACAGSAATPTTDVPVTQTRAAQVAPSTEVAPRASATADGQAATSTAGAQPTAPPSPTAMPTTRPTTATSPTVASRATPTRAPSVPPALGTPGAGQPTVLSPLSDGAAYADPAGRFSFTVPHGWAKNNTPRSSRPDTAVRFTGPARPGNSPV